MDTAQLEEEEDLPMWELTPERRLFDYANSRLYFEKW
jgi:hypothetical protein